MNIVFLIETGEPGGAEQVVLTLACGFRAQGDNVHVVVLQPGWLTDALKEVQIPFTICPSAKRLDVLLPVRLASLFRRLRADVVHSHLLDSNFYGALACRLAGIRHIATDHGDVHLPDEKRLLRFKIRAISLCRSTVTAVSEFTRRRIVSLGGHPRRTVRVYNPVQVVPEYSSVLRQTVRTELGLPASEREMWLWLHAARLTPVKDEPTMLRGFAEALLSNPRQRLLIVGAGPERSRLTSLARELGIESSVEFLGFRKDVPRLFAAADGFILSSRSEAMPMTVLEAATAGVVVVSSSVGGVPEVIREGERGYLFAPGDVSALASRLLEVVSDVAR